MWDRYVRIMSIPVDVLHLGTVRLPEWHPRAADTKCLIQGFLVRHPDGLILFDTGCADDHDVINEMYSPDVVPIVDALNDIDVDERDITAIVNSHLHFDHCGQNRTFPNVPIWVQPAELAAAQEQFFTIAEWAEIAPSRQRVIDGDAVIAEGVTVLSTPGHTPGHQSLLVESDGHRELIVGQACYTCAEFEAGDIAESDVHGDAWLETARGSLDRLRSLGADVARFSHDATVSR